jgi:hypothetical protein
MFHFNGLFPRFQYFWSCFNEIAILPYWYIPIMEHCGGTIWPFLQVTLFFPFLKWSAGQVTVISSSTPCLTGRTGSVTILLNFDSRVVQSESKQNGCVILVALCINYQYEVYDAGVLSIPQIVLLEQSYLVITLLANLRFASLT